jgi:hypothetical protein
VAIGVAVLGAVFSRGREQAWWAGFALFSFGYLAFLMGFWVKFPSQAVTQSALQYAYERIYPDPALQAATTPSLVEFQRMAHAVVAPLCGLIGGMIATRFYARRERRETAG